MADKIDKNPFEVQTPEGMKARDVIELFVDVFSDFYHVRRQGHTFLNGPRGSGKSMMFRFMLPDCQSLRLGKPLNEIDYFSIYIPIKKTAINIIDLGRLESHANILLNEHLLTMFVATITFKSLSEYFHDFNDNNREIGKLLFSFYNDTFKSLISITGYPGDIPLVEEDANIKTIFNKIYTICNGIYNESINYVKRLAFIKEIKPYSGPICGYLDFLFPLLSEIKKLPIFSESPLFLLVDDADNLSDTQKKILNTWVSYRTSAEISLKISTQLNYNIFKTVSGFTIDSPHDYSEVNIATVYTSNKEKYRERVRDIVSLRLKNANINVKVEDFFPADAKQEAKIKEIYDRIKREHKDKGRGNRPADDAYRYATSEYIKQKLKPGRSGSTFSYAGFRQLVNISSGIYRMFLEPASLMYSEIKSKNSGKAVECIPPAIQNKVIKDYSDIFMFEEFDKIEIGDEVQEESNIIKFLSTPEKLRNLIKGMGGLFHEILVSDFSERRVFSIALTDTPDDELSQVLKLGVRYGYLQESSIGDKDRIGRLRLYILSRRLSPYFFLDPSSFAGYKFMPSATLKIALKKPKFFISTVLKKENSEQGRLFSEEELS